MKTTFPLLLGFLLLAAPAPVQAQFIYTTNDATITLAIYTGNGGAVLISNFVTSIGATAFSECTNLTSVTIPGSVRNIGDYAFYDCTSLTSITIPASVTNIGAVPFENCASLTAITVDPNNSFYSNLGGVLFNLSETTLVEYPAGLVGSYRIPGSVTSIGDYAFADCTSLTSVYFTGNAPNADSTVFFRYVGVGYGNPTAYYLPGTTGWADFSANTGIPAVLWNPLIQPSGPNFGVQNSQFGFNITATNNLIVVVEACANLANPVWVPLTTNTLFNGSFYFSEPFQPAASARFYALVMP
jgi:hypothetical protein